MNIIDCGKKGLVKTQKEYRCGRKRVTSRNGSAVALLLTSEVHYPLALIVPLKSLRLRNSVENIYVNQSFTKQRIRFENISAVWINWHCQRFET